MSIDIKNIEKQVKATLKIEGLSPSKQGENITNLFLNGKINSEMAIKQIIKFYTGVKDD